MDIEDRAHRPALVRISADSVRIHITINVASEGCNEVGGQRGAGRGRVRVRGREGGSLVWAAGWLAGD